MAHVSYFGAAGTSLRLGPNAIEVTPGTSGVALVEFDQRVQAAGMLSSDGLQNTDAGRKAFGIVYNDEIFGASPTFDVGTGIYGAVWERRNECQTYKVIGTRGSYESGEYRPNVIVWTFDSMSGITGQTTDLVDAVFVMAGTSTKVEIAWSGDSE
jgi:hypothetical protein